MRGKMRVDKGKNCGDWCEVADIWRAERGDHLIRKRREIRVKNCPGVKKVMAVTTESVLGGDSEARAMILNFP